MIRVALRGLLGRKLRATLTALAIILGVAMMSGTFVLTDTIDKAFSTIFDESYAGTDVVVSGKGADIDFQGLQAEAPPVDESLVAEVNALPGVEIASGSVADETNTKIIGSDGKAINTQGAPSLGFGIDTGPEVERFNPLNLVEGTWADGDGQVVIDAGTADREGYEVGDTIQISTLQPKQDFELTGIAKFGDVDSLGTATFAIFDLPTAQRLLDREGKVDSISVAAAEGTTPEQLIEEIQPILPADAQVRSAQVEAQEDKDEVNEFISFIQYFLLAFAGIALFVGAFVIFNTLSITVAQRTREFATMRTVGASRRQILWSVIVEALTIGFIASVIGLFAGLGLAIGLNELFKVLDFELPTANTVFATRTIVVSLLVGTGITLVAGVFPAIRATRVPPIAAVREGFTLPKSRFAPFVPYIAVAVIVLALLLLGYSMFRDELDTAARLLSIAGGVLLLFVGVAMISSRLVKPLAAVVGWPARALGGPGGQARPRELHPQPRPHGDHRGRAHDRHRPRHVRRRARERHEGLQPRARSRTRCRADYVITAQDGFTPFVAAAGDEVAGSDDAEVVSNVRADLGKVGDSSTYVTGIDAEHHPRDLQLRLEGRRRCGRPEPRAERRHRRRQVRRGQRHRRRRHDCDPDPLGRHARADGQGSLRAAAVLPAPGRRLGDDRDVRHLLRATAEPVHVRERPRRPDGRDDRVARGRRRELPRRQGADAGGVDRPAGPGLRPVPPDAVHPPRPRRDREHLRDDQHARPLGLRADA